ncbi:hypothetical protein CKO21_05935 [Rhodovibrio salinarum]|uniref:Uncharacterized protein n=1 Tax=Rhodovibrio salinarum TaxID=1087 RepID=A0A934QGW2_9PROT|nr:hypothetical protein [Rhodovibrio salinarum]
MVCARPRIEKTFRPAACRAVRIGLLPTRQIGCVRGGAWYGIVPDTLKMEPAWTGRRAGFDRAGPT